RGAGADGIRGGVSRRASGGGRMGCDDSYATIAVVHIHMKRTNLVLNEELLDEATRILGAKTYSEAVNTALQEVVRRNQVQSITRFLEPGFGKVICPRCERTGRGGGRSD